MVAIKAGREVGNEGITALHEIGCTAELRYAEAYEDGRFDIIVTGMTRFRLLEVEPSAPMRADVDLLSDDQSPQSIALARRVAPAIRQLSGGPAQPLRACRTRVTTTRRNCRTTRQSWPTWWPPR